MTSAKTRARIYFITEFVDGKTLGALVRDNQRLEFARGRRLRAAGGPRAQVAHDQNMFHRDLSPEVLLLDRQGLVKVVDLGLAKTPDAAEAEEAALCRQARAFSGRSRRRATAVSQTTLPSVSIGTPGYMAPELAENPAGAGPRTDIYSLGCTLYFLLTGRPPFEGRTAVEILNQQQTQPIVPPDELVKVVPKALSAVVLKMAATKARRSLCRHGRRHPRPRSESRHFERQPDLRERRAGQASRTERDRLARVAVRATSGQGHRRRSSRLALGSRCSACCPAGGLPPRRSSVSASSPRWLISPSSGSGDKTPLFQKVIALVLGSSAFRVAHGPGRAALAGRVAPGREAVLDLGGARARRSRDRARASSARPSRLSRAPRAARARRNDRAIAAPARPRRRRRPAVRVQRQADSTGKSFTKPSSAMSRCCRPATAGSEATARKPGPGSRPGATRSSGGSMPGSPARREAKEQAVLQKFEERGSGKPGREPA